jgi:hypothetical protein
MHGTNVGGGGTFKIFKIQKDEIYIVLNIVTAL